MCYSVFEGNMSVTLCHIVVCLCYSVLEDNMPFVLVFGKIKCLCHNVLKSNVCVIVCGKITCL